MSRLLDRVEDFGAALAALLLLFQVLSVSLDVMLRYFFDFPLRWVVAVNEWSLLGVAFLAAAWLQRLNGHVRLDMILTIAGPRGQRSLEVFGLLVGLAICVVLVWFGVRETWVNLVEDRYDFFKLRDVPIWPVYLMIPLGSLLWLLELSRQLWQSMQSQVASTDHEHRTDL